MIGRSVKKCMEAAADLFAAVFVFCFVCLSDSAVCLGVCILL